MQVPLYNAPLAQSMWRQDVDENALAVMEDQDSWSWWNNFRWSCDFHSKLRVVLELHEDDVPELEVVRRWVGEPLEAVILPASLFITNSSNYPVLPKSWQEILQHFLNANVNILVATDPADNRLRQITSYLRNFTKAHCDEHILQRYSHRNILNRYYSNCFIIVGNVFIVMKTFWKHHYNRSTTI